MAGRCGTAAVRRDREVREGRGDARSGLPGVPLRGRPGALAPYLLLLRRALVLRVDVRDAGRDGRGRDRRIDRAPPTHRRLPRRARGRGCRPDGHVPLRAGGTVARIGRRPRSGEGAGLCPLPGHLGDGASGALRDHGPPSGLMPEWPELRVMQERIADALVGKKVVAVRTGDPEVLRAEKPVDELLVGRTLREVTHHGKFLVFAFDGLEMTVNPMLAGIFSLQPVGAKATKDTRLRLELDGGTELRYRDDVRMGKVYVGLAAPGYEDLGPDAGTPASTESEVSTRAKAKRSQGRNLLQDQTFVSGIGNAYADEILWTPKLHPKRRVGSLTKDEMHRLYTSLRSVVATGLAS